jgi:imidazolonepropionase-like amidohydrolase
MLKRGFTTIRDCGGAGLALKEALAENLYPGPRLFTCGHAMSQTGGHGDLRDARDAEYGTRGSSGHVRGYGRVADGADECLRAAREELRQGADFIRIMVSGGVASPTDRLASLQYTSEEVRAFVQVAANAGTYVTAHAHTPAAIRHALENGVRGIDHGNFLDDATAVLMAEKGAFLTPTLITYASMSMPESAAFLPPATASKNAQVLNSSVASLQVADKAGVTMCFGTDLLGSLQAKQTGEFVLRKRAGLSALKILQSATINAAKLLQKENRLGRLREGSAADLLILNANPLEDIEVLDRPRKHLLAVIKDGRVLESRWYSLAKDVDREPIIE